VFVVGIDKESYKFIVVFPGMEGEFVKGLRVCPHPYGQQEKGCYATYD
jgi:hypothetical protein